ncbi:hypothetical protein R3P38DRAFT_3172277 [Favolaschia claudopus]|uniref:Uncharacterized protein n=1 Tax=Favolaschia claudopus TaxID=2862362 RepID=A0AAW0DKX7_9AGAR
MPSAISTTKSLTPGVVALDIVIEAEAPCRFLLTHSLSSRSSPLHIMLSFSYTSYRFLPSSTHHRRLPTSPLGHPQPYRMHMPPPPPPTSSPTSRGRTPSLPQVYQDQRRVVCVGPECMDLLHFKATHGSLFRLKPESFSPRRGSIKREWYLGFGPLRRPSILSDLASVPADFGSPCSHHLAVFKLNLLHAQDAGARSFAVLDTVAMRRGRRWNVAVGVDSGGDLDVHDVENDLKPLDAQNNDAGGPGVDADGDASCGVVVLTQCSRPAPHIDSLDIGPSYLTSAAALKLIRHATHWGAYIYTSHLSVSTKMKLHEGA